MQLAGYSNYLDDNRQCNLWRQAALGLPEVIVADLEQFIAAVEVSCLSCLVVLYLVCAGNFGIATFINTTG
jgi:hypothetical protein